MGSLLLEYLCGGCLTTMTDPVTLREFSHGLMSLLARVRRKDPQAITDEDKALRDRFTEKVRDSHLRRELKRYVREHPNLTFKDLREEALRWAEEVYPARKGVTSNLVDVTGDPSCDRTDVVGATGGAKTIELLQDQMKALIQLQENQQEQIKQQGQMITTLAEGINKRMEGMSKRMDNAWIS